MTREEAKELMPIIQAFTEGKTIEYREYDGEWKSITYTYMEQPSFLPHQTRAKVQTIQKRGRMLVGNAETSAFRVA